MFVFLVYIRFIRFKAFNLTKVESTSQKEHVKIRQNQQALANLQLV